jgi:hypothetical protein
VLGPRFAGVRLAQLGGIPDGSAEICDDAQEGLCALATAARRCSSARLPAGPNLVLAIDAKDGEDPGDVQGHLVHQLRLRRRPCAHRGCQGPVTYCKEKERQSSRTALRTCMNDQQMPQKSTVEI